MAGWVEFGRDFLRWLMRSRSEPVPPPAGEKTKRALFYDIMMHRLEMQSRASDALAQRTATWLTVPSLVITFLATLLVAERERIGALSYAIILRGFILYILSLVFLFFAYRPITWLEGPYWQEIARDAYDARYNADDMHYSIGHFLGTETLIENDKQIRRQTRLLEVGVVLALLSVIVLLAVVLFNLLYKTAISA